MADEDRPVNRVVAISGASAGVGRAAARGFARSGYDVAVLARGEAGLEAAAADIKAEGRRALALPVDVADHTAVEEAVDVIERELGPIDVWVNAAFASILAPFSKVEPHEYTRVTDVCYHGYVHGTHAALKRMTERDRGTIVQVGSALAYRAIPLQSAYCGAKHAVRGFTDSLRTELAHDGSNVRITTVHLPAVNTPQFSWVRARVGSQTRPVPPVYQPEVTARAIVFAAEHPRRREYWVGASTVGTILANRLAPGLLDRYLARTGYEAQKRPGTDRAEGDDNLFEPLDTDEDYGAHGVFDEESRDSSAQQWVSEHRGAITGGVLTGAAAVGLVALRRGRRRPRGLSLRTRRLRSHRRLL